MDECIERDKLKRLILDDNSPWTVSMVIRHIDKCPAADVTPVRHGRWLEYENNADRGYHYCSHCKRQAINYSDGGVITEVLSPYCPYCGAKMDAEG